MRNRLLIVTIVALLCLAFGAGSALAACDKGTTKTCKASMKAPAAAAGSVESLAEELAAAQEAMAEVEADIAKNGLNELNDMQKADLESKIAGLRSELAEKAEAYKAASAQARTEMQKAEADGDNSKARKVAVKYQEKLNDQDAEVEELLLQAQTKTE